METTLSYKVTQCQSVNVMIRYQRTEQLGSTDGQ